MTRLNAKQLRSTDTPDQGLAQSIKKNPIYIVLDNVYDTYNIGALFRLADATAVQKMYLCGTTETPPNPKIKKASVSTWKWVDWEYTKTTVEAITRLKSQVPNIQIIAVELNENSVPLKDLNPTFPVAVIVGSESHGVSKEVLDISDTIVELPMYGINVSLNVMVSCGIVLYKIAEYLQTSK